MLGQHLLGIYEKALPPELSWIDRLNAAKEMSFDYMEVSIDETDERLARLDMDSSLRRSLHKAIDRTGVPILSMCLSGHRRFPFGSADSKIRAEANRIMEKAILFAREFGIRVIQLAGYDVYYEPSTADSLRLFGEGLKNACRMAERQQVMLAMEIMDTKLISSVSRYKAWKEHLPSAWFSVYPDLGNLSAWGNDTIKELCLGSHEIVGVHLKDTIAVSPSFAGKFKCVRFGDGCVDFSACFKQLEQQEYCGPYLIEMWNTPNEDWRKEISKAKAFIEEQFIKATEDKNEILFRN